MNQISICFMIYVRFTTSLYFTVLRKSVIVEFLLNFVNKLKLRTVFHLTLCHCLVIEIKSFGLHK